MRDFILKTFNLYTDVTHQYQTRLKIDYKMTILGLTVSLKDFYEFNCQTGYHLS